MTDSTGTTSSGSMGPRPNVTAYALCVLAGLVVGVVGAMTFSSGGSKSGPDAVVAEYDGKSVRAGEAYGQAKTRIFDLEEELYRTKEQAIKDYVEQKLLEAAAKKANLPVDQLLEKEAGAGAVTEVTDKDIETFLTSKGLTLNDPRIRKEDVREYLKYRQKFEKRQAYVEKLRNEAKVSLYIHEPESPKIAVSGDGYPAWGNASAPVTIFEFSDFQCPFCARAVPTIDRIKKEYGPDKVRIIFRYMPLPSHNRALPAALAASCANEQGKFWEFHDKLFANQAKLEDGDLKGYAKDLGLDATKFGDCYDKKKYADVINKSRSEGEAVGISATPSFVINGGLLQGAQPFEKFKDKIDRAHHT